MTILDKAQQVAADTLAELGFRATADAVIKNLPVRHQPSEYVCAVLDALSAANLLAREPRELTDEDIDRIWKESDRIGQVRSFARRLIAIAYPGYATKEKELAEAEEKIEELKAEIDNGIALAYNSRPADERTDDTVCLDEQIGKLVDSCNTRIAVLEAQLKRPTFCGPNLRSAQAAVMYWRDSDITSEAIVARNFINNCKPIFEVEAPLRKAIEELTATNDTQASKIRAVVETAEKHGWNGVENSKILETFLDDLITEQAEEIEQLRGELATALDAREKRVRELLSKLDRGEDKACIELYSNGSVQIADADGDILDMQVMGMGEAIAALEKLTAEKKPEPTPEETIAKAKIALGNSQTMHQADCFSGLVDLAEQQAKELEHYRKAGGEA